MKRLAVLLAFTCLTAPALADTPAKAVLPMLATVPAVTCVMPKAIGRDSGIRYADFDRTRRTCLQSTGMVPLIVMFPPGEVPDTVSGIYVDHADAPSSAEDKKKAAAPPCDSWCWTKKENFLTLQPMRPDIPPSVVVILVKRDSEPTLVPFAFQLTVTKAAVATDGQDDTGYFEVMLTDPERDAARKAVAAKEAREAALARWRATEDDKANARLQQAKFSAPRNWKWGLTPGPACDFLRPKNVSDDGVMVTIEFAMNAPASQPFRETPEGKPTPLEFTASRTLDGGTLMTLHEAPQRIILIRDKMACGLQNPRYNPDAVGPGTTTITNSVVQEVRAASPNKAAR